MQSENYVNYMEISRADLWQNAQAVKEYVDVSVIGVVKCDGYGVGVAEAARAWQQAGAAMFAVSVPEEALELRRKGFTEDILLLSPVADPRMLNVLLEHKIILTVTGIHNAQFYKRNAGRLPIRAHIAIDTGMGRFGIRWTDMAQLQAVYEVDHICYEGIFSHFAKSYEREYAQTKRQLERFLGLTDSLTALGYPVGIRHIANSCAALRFPQTRLDAVRIGSALVGVLCTEVPVPLRRVGTFKAQVVDRRQLLPGDTTGYGAVCRVKEHTNAIVVAIGRQDGFGYLNRPDRFGPGEMIRYMYRLLRRFAVRPWVEYHGQYLPLVGRIGNEYTLFDAAGVEIGPGDHVTARVPLLFSHRRRFFQTDPERVPVPVSGNNT